MNQKVTLVETAREKIGRILSENYDIRVVYQQDMCCTDGKKIYLPVVGPNADKGLEKALAGMLDHEAAHILWSDFDLLEEVKRDAKPENWKVEPLLQVVEDARVEARMKDRWRGTRVNLDFLNEWGLQKVWDCWSKLSEWGKFTTICGRIAAGQNDHWLIAEAEKTDPHLVLYARAAQDLLEQAQDQDTSRQCLELVRKCLKRLHSLAAQGGINAPGLGTGTTDFETGFRPSNRQPNERDEKGQIKNNSPIPDFLDPTFVPEEKTRKKDEEIVALEFHIQNEARQSLPKNNKGYLVYSTERDVIQKVSGGDRKHTKRLLDSSRHVTNALYQNLVRNLMATSYSRWEANQERGSINPKALHKVIVGSSKKVFRRRKEAPSFNTRCILLVDHSSSMQGRKLRLAAESATIFGEVLSRIQIPFEVCGFSTTTTYNEGHGIYNKASAQDKKTFTRWGGLWIGIYKAFGEQWEHTKHRLSRMVYNQRHNTFDGESVLWAAKRLLQYSEKRKVIFLFNDGEPCPNVHSFIEEHKAYAKSVAEEVEKHLDLIAIGILSSQIKDYYSNSICIEELNDLPGATLGQLNKILRNAQRLFAV